LRIPGPPAWPSTPSPTSTSGSGWATARRTSIPSPCSRRGRPQPPRRRPRRRPHRLPHRSRHRRRQHNRRLRRRRPNRRRRRRRRPRRPSRPRLPRRSRRPPRHRSRRRPVPTRERRPPRNRSRERRPARWSRSLLSTLRRCLRRDLRFSPQGRPCGGRRPRALERSSEWPRPRRRPRKRVSPSARPRERRPGTGRWSCGIRSRRGGSSRSSGTRPRSMWRPRRERVATSPRLRAGGVCSRWPSEWSQP
jgi:hypothetical protein